ncbi:MAG: PDZ domain-containing protein [Phycisphaerales bacterium]|nr:MAG: PDZ domain-containing protein [Phycisphaerales bacterium]
MTMKLPMMKRCEAQGSAGFAHRAGSRRGAGVLAVLTASGLVCAGAMAQSAGGGGSGEGSGAERQRGEEVRRGGGAGGGGVGSPREREDGEERRVERIFLAPSGGPAASIRLEFDADGSLNIGDMIERLSRVSPPNVEFRVDRLSDRPSLGVVLADPDPVLLEHLGIEPGSAVLIQSVIPGTPAEQAGLQSNDLVIEVNGQRAGDVDRFRAKINERKAGEPVRLKIVRRGERREVTVTPQERARPRGPAVDLSLRVDAEASLVALKEKLQRALERNTWVDMRRDVQDAIGSVEELSERLSSVRFDVSRDADGRSELRYVDPRTGQERRMVLPGGAVRGGVGSRAEGLPSEILERVRRMPSGGETLEYPPRDRSASADRLDRLEASVERLEGKLDRLLEKLSDR